MKNRLRFAAARLFALECVFSCIMFCQAGDSAMEFVKGALEYVSQCANGDMADLDDPCRDVGMPTTLTSFLGRGETNEMTFAERKFAFDSYLTSLGTNDCLNFSCQDKQLVRVAIRQCEILSYTNAVSALKALSLNPRGIFRHNAMDLVLKWEPINDNTTAYVESIMTNLQYTLVERGTACGLYAHNLIRDRDSCFIAGPIRNHAVDMLYSQRCSDLVGTKILDELFVDFYDGYEFSSNRLAFANFVLTHPQRQTYDQRDFTAITNQLISSGRSLRWINIGGTTE